MFSKAVFKIITIRREKTRNKSSKRMPQSVYNAHVQTALLGHRHGRSAT